MKTNDYVKFMTEQFVTYVDQPKEVKQAKREEKKEHRQPMSFRLFGMIPFALRLMWNRKRHE
ncbi:YqzE family protein [Salipaludibacillus keqinensis]|uniref:YqzE family protein n=1 Tax=Salipaludibacillus keqinensis TaxID=2045207 RepID=A0A323TJR9_9BACI|nr:YqzE family protein [Salipaludibacillus keqinensis]PYZ94326.1 YqzE family protein [Salipaludibacillus keqinensis]